MWTRPKPQHFRFLCVALVGIYFAVYLLLTILGDWFYSQSGESRNEFGLGVADIIEWRPKGLWWQGRFKNVDGQYTSRGNAYGYFYSPLISLDRSVWHKTRIIADELHSTHNKVGAANRSEPIGSLPNGTSPEGRSRR
jgi:hypothetical protein